MRNLWLALALFALAPTSTLAQGGPPPGKGSARRMYDPATVVTMSGTVTGETRVDRGHGHKGVHLTLKTAEGEIQVHLGPDSYVDRQKVKIAKGDEVTVKGSKFTYDDKFGVIAQTVTRGGDTLVLRDAAGKPAWNASK